MNDIDLWHEAEDYENDKDEEIQKIGGELFKLYAVQYGDSEDEELIDIVFEQGNTWNIYDDIQNGMTFQDSVKKYKKKGAE